MSYTIVFLFTEVNNFVLIELCVSLATFTSLIKKLSNAHLWTKYILRYLIPLFPLNHELLKKNITKFYRQNTNIKYKEKLHVSSSRVRSHLIPPFCTQNLCFAVLTFFMTKRNNYIKFCFEFCTMITWSI